MFKKITLTAICISIGLISFSQTKSNANSYVDFSAAFAESQTAFSGSYFHNWGLGKKKKWEIGYGIRSTTFFGTKNEFITAPANLARTTTIPFAIVFAGEKEQNLDTLNVQRPFTNSINLSANFGYHLSSRLSVGFNIDVIGFTYGRTSSAVLTSNGVTKTEIAAKPAPFNLLLTGDNDLGSLNSELFLKYKLNNKWGLKAVYQFLFVEYKTTTIKQIAPDGTQVDRFRTKANLFGVGVSYQL